MFMSALCHLEITSNNSSVLVTPTYQQKPTDQSNATLAFDRSTDLEPDAVKSVTLCVEGQSSGCVDNSIHDAPAGGQNGIRHIKE